MVHRSTFRDLWKNHPVKRVLLIAVLLLSGALGTTFYVIGRAHAANPTIAINKNIQYQQIDGFGGFGGKVPWFTNGPFYDDAFINTIVDDLGATIIRDEVPPSFEQDQGVYDANAAPRDSCHGQSVALSEHIPYWRALKAEADAKGEPLKFIASVWSPPAWMKYVNCVFGGDQTWNRLIVSEIPSASVPNDRKADFADYLVHYVQEMKRQTGIDVYAISIQNEPFFAQGYPSAVYSSEVLKNTIKVVGQAFQNNGITTKIFMPEDVTDFARISSYFQWAETDPVARQYVNYFAVHGYGPDGITGSGSQQFWTQAHELAATYNVPLWQTETSGYTNNWNGAMSLAGSIYTALKYGQASAWVWWALGDPTATDYALLNNGAPTSLFYASKQFYRYIRPGAVMVDANSPDSDVLVTAFKHVQNKTLTAVLINRSGSSKTLDLSIQGSNIPAQFTVYRSTSSENVANVGTVASNGTLTLPANSIVTLYGTSSGQDSLQAPSFVTQPQNVSVNEGGSATFRVQATGTPTLQYQWLRNGATIAGATGSIYTHPVTAADNGAQYSVRVSNGQGTVTSNTATLTVNAFNGASVVSATTAPTIDGNGNDAVWGSANSYSISHRTASPNNISASYKSAWDSNNLYLLVNVQDASYAGGSDGIEVYLDGDNSKSNGYYDVNDWQYAFTWGSSTVNQYKGGSQGTNTTGVQFSQVAVSGGYQLEVKFPWSTLGISASAGSIIGFDVDVAQQTTSGTTNGKLFWNATTDDDWHDPSQFGVAKLSGSGGPNPTPTPGATPTPTPGVTPTPGGTWTHCANEGETCTFSGTAQVRYGASGQFFYKTATGSIACTNAVFGDPIPGTFKSCDYQSTTAATPTPTPGVTPTPTPTPSGTTWTHCANEGETCTFSGTHQVRYGANGSYNYQTATGSISCTNTVFGDPIVGTFKSCDYQ